MTDWKSQARTTLVTLLEQAEKVGERVGNREAAGEEPGPDPKSVEALVKLIQVVSDVVTAGETLERGSGGGDEQE